MFFLWNQNFNTFYLFQLTLAQLKNTGKVMKNVCQPKNNVTHGTIISFIYCLYTMWLNNIEFSDQIKNIQKGDFPEDRNVKCYIACILQMARMVRIFPFKTSELSSYWLVKMFQMKNGKLNYDAAVKQIDLMFPEEMKTPVKKALSDCRKVRECLVFEFIWKYLWKNFDYTFFSVFQLINTKMCARLLSMRQNAYTILIQPILFSRNLLKFFEWWNDFFSILWTWYV